MIGHLKNTIQIRSFWQFFEAKIEVQFWHKTAENDNIFDFRPVCKGLLEYLDFFQTNQENGATSNIDSKKVKNG